MFCSISKLHAFGKIPVAPRFFKHLPNSIHNQKTLNIHASRNEIQISKNFGTWYPQFFPFKKDFLFPG